MHGGSGWSGDGWGHTKKKAQQQPPPPLPHLTHTNFRRRKRKKRGASERRSEPRSSFLRGITKMGDTESLEKSWLVGRGGRRGETLDSGVFIYGDKDAREYYSLPPDPNGDACWDSTYFILHKLSNVWFPITFIYCLILYTQGDCLNSNIAYFGVTI